MGSYNVRRVRLQKQLNHFVKQMGGGETGKKAVAAAIVRHRKVFGPKSKAVAFWRAGYVFRDGKFIPTGSTKQRKVQYATGKKGAGSAGILRQNVGLVIGMKTSKGAGKKANTKTGTYKLSGATAKRVASIVKSGNIPKGTGSTLKQLNKYIRGNESFKKLAKRDADSRKRSDRAKRAADARKTKLARERALAPTPKRRKKK